MLPGRQERWQRDPRAGVLVIVAGVALAAFVGLAVALLIAPAFVSADIAVSAAIRSIDLPGLEAFARFATHVGDFWPIAGLTAVTAAILWARGRRAEAVMVVVAVLGSALLGAGLKQVFMRVRPALEVARIPLPETYSFPSGHALSSVVYFGSLIFVALVDVRRLGRALLLVGACGLVALTISFSRVYLGVHYLGDVVGAWLLGFSWLALVVLVSARWGAGDADDASR
jgi:undecaprenyl-diphosphatase